MNNVMLDPLPEEWNGYRVDADFQIGIQISQILDDGELSEFERIAACCDLLYLDMPEDGNVAIEGMTWFLNGWNHDHHGSKKKSKTVVDFDIDQWRIYSAFYSQYSIDLNSISLHWWQFMGLLTSLDECAYTRIVDIRMRDITAKMSQEEKRELAKAKKIYSIKNNEESTEMTQEEQERYDSFMKFAKIKRKEEIE